MVGDFESASVFFPSAVAGLREAGRLGLLPRMLALQAGVAARLADWTTARPAADEVRRLATELNEPIFAAAGDTVASLIAGMRGDDDAAEAAAARVEQVALPAGVNVLVAQAQFGRIAAALRAGRPDDAHVLAERIFDPFDPAHHPRMARWVIGDLAEAALQTDRLTEGRKRVEEVATAVGANPGAWLAVNLRHARAVLADEHDAASSFEAALGADLSGWPYHRARLLLAHGRWLRRRRGITESRAALRAARDAFDALGCISWSEQARHELRASGERSRRRVPEARDQLTEQELQIAQLAAEGLSNREIGQRLFLSHRTVSTHLYRAFPSSASRRVATWAPRSRRPRFLQTRPTTISGSRRKPERDVGSRSWCSIASSSYFRAIVARTIRAARPCELQTLLKRASHLLGLSGCGRKFDLVEGRVGEPTARHAHQ